MKKLSFILALVLILSTFTFPTFAAVADTDEAKIGDVGYATLKDAIDVAKVNGGTITLLKDVTIPNDGFNLYGDAAATNTEGFSIDGNGKTISVTIVTDYRAAFYVKYPLTITDAKFEVTSSITNSWGAIASRGSTSNVVLDGCTVNVRGSSGSAAFGMNNSGKIKLVDTTVTSVFKVFHDQGSNGTVTAENSTAVAPSLGINSVSGLTFTENVNPFAEPTVATVGTEEFSSLENAVAYAAANGGTVELLEDVTIASPEGINITPSQDFIINGNNHTVTSLIQTTNARATFYIQAKTVTFNNIVFESSLNGTGCWGVIISKNAGTNVILNECTVNARGTASLGTYSFIGGGSLQLNNTTTKSVFKGFYFHAAGAGNITATSSTLVAPSIGDTTVASGLIFTETTDPFDEAVASIGTTQYPTLASAIAAVKEGETVKLLEHVSSSVVITRNNISWTLDGNGKSINSTDSIALDITSTGGNVTVKNLTVIDNHSGTGHGLALRVQNGTVTLDNCKLSTIGSKNTWGASFVNNSGTLNVTNGTVLDGGKNPGVYIYDTTGTCNVYDGTLKGNVIAYNNANGGTFKMYGGKTVVGSTTTSYNPVILDGTSIRTTENSNGIRFTTSISADLLAHIKSLGATKVSYGTVIFKTENYKALGNAAPAAAGWANGTYVDIAAKNGFMGDTENGPFVFNAALTNIQDKNLDANFGAISYVEYTVGSETFRIYSEYNEENNSRKIKDVALAALKDIANASTNGEYEKDGWEYKYEIAFYYDENGQRVEGKAYSCYTAEQYAVVEKIYNRQPVAN